MDLATNVARADGLRTNTYVSQTTNHYLDARPREAHLSLHEGRIDANGEQAPSFFMAPPRPLEQNVGIHSQGERLLFPIKAVVVAPVPAAVR